MPKVTNSIKHNGGSITFIKMKALIEFLHCSLCGKKIEVGQKIHIVIPNKQQFPNTRVHHKCTKPPAPFDKNNGLVWTAGQLSKSWEEAQQYRHWFMD